MGKDATEAGYAYKRIANEIEQQIRSGVLPPGTRLPTVRAYAEELGCHYHTIRRAFQELADKGLIERKQGSGSYVMGLPAILPQHAIPIQRKVGVIFEPGKCGYYLDRLLSFLHVEAGRMELQMTLRTTSALDSSATQIIEDLAGEGCSAIVVPWVSPRTEPSAFISLVQNSPIPVATPLALPGIERSSYLSEADRTEIAEELISISASYLQGLGHGNIALVGPALATNIPTFFHHVMMAYSSYVLENGLPNHLCPVRTKQPGCYDPLVERWRPSFGNMAVFCYHDQIAVALQNALIRNGVRVPEDVAILSHNNDPISEAALPGISTFVSAHSAIAGALLKHAQNLVEGKERDPKPKEPRELIVRESCGGFMRLGDKLNDLTDSLGIGLFRQKQMIHHDLG